MRLGYLLPLCLVFLACAGPKLPTSGEDADARIMSDLDLTPWEAARLEMKLKLDPHDVVARTMLLEYYFYRGPEKLPSRPEIEARSKHILWLIRNRPEAAVLARPESMRTQCWLRTFPFGTPETTSITATWFWAELRLPRVILKKRRVA